MQSRKSPLERNGARKKPRTPTPNYTLDTAVVVIDVMTNARETASPFDKLRAGCSGATAAFAQNDLEEDADPSTPTETS
jgi:hypothetical protein